MASINDNPAPMTLDHLIGSLQAIRAKIGGDVPVVMSDFEPVVRAGIVQHPGPLQERIRLALLGEEDTEPRPWVVITDRYEEADEIGSND